MLWGESTPCKIHYNYRKEKKAKHCVQQKAQEDLKYLKEIYFLCSMARTLQFLFTILNRLRDRCHLKQL